MNPHSNEVPAPQSPTEQIPQGSSDSSGSIEKAPASGENTPSPSNAAPPIPALPAVSLPAMPPAPVQAAAGQAIQSQTSSIRDDGDLIEKEWVNKAKQIVERTRDDPYKQSEELTVFKADYMKKRYGKAIKLK